MHYALQKGMYITCYCSFLFLYLLLPTALYPYLSYLSYHPITAYTSPTYILYEGLAQQRGPCGDLFAIHYSPVLSCAFQVLNELASVINSKRGTKKITNLLPPTMQSLRVITFLYQFTTVP